ncbi:MAG: di-heme oxidoredictase family protein, partial [Betaproteobacteria bacterium]
SGAIGYLFLNGKRLGNLSAIEAIPNQSIIDFNAAEKSVLGESIAGEIIWNAGTRDGVDGKVQLTCRTKSLADCFIARFGWIGDRVSLEDQVANAAFVEMNMTTSEGYKKLYPRGKELFPVRYAHPNCGPANKTCVQSGGNADLTELDIDRMAEYGRWLGNPTRSELKVALPEVIAGEKIFRRVNCDSCHVIKKIDIVPEDTMLNKAARDRLTTRVAQPASPFLSYIGTDLLMHDMGYLSQLADASQSIRDKDGVVLPTYRNYMQKIRTPPLKGLRFNRFVTESHKNTKIAGDPACDFLLHDGRACDAIEAAFLHDGPAIKKLGVIEGLNGLTATEVLQLRAFLYSL